MNSRHTTLITNGKVSLHFTYTTLCMLKQQSSHHYETDFWRHAITYDVTVKTWRQCLNRSTTHLDTRYEGRIECADSITIAENLKILDKKRTPNFLEERQLRPSSSYLINRLYEYYYSVQKHQFPCPLPHTALRPRDAAEATLTAREAHSIYSVSTIHSYPSHRANQPHSSTHSPAPLSNLGHSHGRFRRINIHSSPPNIYPSYSHH